MLIFYLMSRKYNNYGSGSSKLAVFWLIGSMFLSVVKFILNPIIMLSKRLKLPINKGG